MTQYLPPNLLALFAPRDPIPYLPPVDKLPFQKKTTGYTGVAKYVSYFEDPKDTPPPKRIESREEHLERKRREKAEQVIYRLEQRIASWDPQNNATSTTDPYKTLFIARINYDTSESKLRREFEAYGTIKKVIIVHDKISGKHRGYAFIEYEHERDMHAAYKYADGKKIDGRRVLVDVERGRTVKGWLPRKLGGGLGGTRRGGPDQNAKHSGREDNRYDDAEREKFERMNLSRDRERDRGDRGDRDRGDRGERTERSERTERGDRGDRDRRRRRSRSRDEKRDRERRKRSRSPRDKERAERGERERRRVDGSKSPTKVAAF
ncbi:U1 small nuclear ribonucleoprotein 70 kDa-like isoform X2 [Panonychus citri]|uniref:U1 small nuclear ribonucleoprotein 70 kDa-like isoform X2 n=1 Tax=Panonychus citri TaxID=50023 RepID=UPI0023078976|nr:U1 small nuclear ribonucleoprotein 70 kDa-like isoform X2 [Panonychus citri]